MEDESSHATKLYDDEQHNERKGQIDIHVQERKNRKNSNGKQAKKENKKITTSDTRTEDNPSYALIIMVSSSYSCSPLPPSSPPPFLSFSKSCTLGSLSCIVLQEEERERLFLGLKEDNQVKTMNNKFAKKRQKMMMMQQRIHATYR